MMRLNWEVVLSTGASIIPSPEGDYFAFGFGLEIAPESFQDTPTPQIIVHENPPMKKDRK
jgi:hypothetical protein